MSDMTIANEISKQIGNAAFCMIGAKNLVGGDNYLTFKIMRNAKRVTHVRVTLDPSDTYTVEFIRCWGTKAPEILESVEGIYCDMLKSVIGCGTGLEMSMPTIRRVA